VRIYSLYLIYFINIKAYILVNRICKSDIAGNSTVGELYFAKLGNKIFKKIASRWRPQPKIMNRANDLGLGGTPALTFEIGVELSDRMARLRPAAVRTVELDRRKNGFETHFRLQDNGFI
jgi:hypothetical protein